MPFYGDVGREGLAVPALVQFLYVRRVDDNQTANAQLDEDHDAAWFTPPELDNLPTF